MNTKFSSKFLITKHAIEQIVSRKHLETESNMFNILRKNIDKKVLKLKEKTRSGEEQWFVPSLDCILITKPEKNKNVVVTIVKSKFLNAMTFEEILIEKLLKFDTTKKKIKKHEN